ncbi:MAG: hypothetical protein V4487_07545 [Chlamydiota bacterium]
MSIDALSDLNELGIEELRARTVQNIATAQDAAALPIKIAAPQGLSCVSSIAASPKKETAFASRPELEPPKKHYMIDLLKAHQETERLTHKQSKLFETQVNLDTAELEKLSLEKEEALKKAAQEAATRDTWGVFATVAQYIAHAATIIVGIACIATGVGTAAGALLIASGGLGLLNRVMHDTHGWQAVVSWFTKSQELQIKIANQIEMGAFFLSLGLGLAGGIWAYKAGAFAAAAADVGKQGLIAKIGQVVTVGSTVMGAGSRFGGSVSERRLAHHHARIKEIETQMTTNHQTIYQNSSDVEKMLETNQSIGEEIRKGISASQVVEGWRNL